MTDGRERMIVALDFPSYEKAREFIEKLGDHVWFYKVGLELFLNSQGRIVAFLKEKKKRIFLDLKFHDIPNTTAQAAVFAAGQDVFMFNVHAGGGKKMMKAVAEEVKKINPRTLMMAVTILTSISEQEAAETFGSRWTIKELAVNLARLAREAGMDGVVCSPWEAKDVKAAIGNDFKTVCPGIRLRENSTDDQERIMTPYDAILNGCDYLVIGRPITKSPYPITSADAIAGEIEKALRKG
ncbi:MAG: orotidine-5'-phosphate decarboxylase [Fusobacteriaceae bacterium]|jgi:orotidine-5'-phosphate decarboxylase|nr:orotidine-5'-phosphate decarboxylase [Fusobacteriaceae bacterium]